MHRDRDITYSTDSLEKIQAQQPVMVAEPRDALEQLLEDIEAAKDAGVAVLDDFDEEDLELGDQDEVGDHEELEDGLEE